MRQGFPWRRLGVALLAGTCVVAIILGGVACPRPAREQGPPRYAVVPGNLVDASRATARFVPTDHEVSFLLDTKTGDLRRWRSRETDLLSDATCSPWVDETGRSQVVGVWRGERAALSFAGVGIERISCPDGAILDRVALDMLPIGPICWLPGTAARVIFAGGDGRLYRFAFEESDAPGEPSVGRCAGPTPLAWRTDPPVRSRFYLREPSVPAHPRLAGELLVSLEVCNGHEEGSPRAPRELWRLQLDPQATSIVAATRLLDPGAPEEAPFERRFPVLAGQFDGSLVLAYMAGDSERGYQLRVAPAQFDPRTGAPRRWRPRSGSWPRAVSGFRRSSRRTAGRSAAFRSRTGRCPGRSAWMSARSPARWRTRRAIRTWCPPKGRCRVHFDEPIVEGPALLAVSFPGGDHSGGSLMEASPTPPLGSDARTLPAGYYTDPAIYRAEMERFFRKSWVCAGREEQVTGRGDYFLRDVDDESIIIVRDLEGSLKAFYNVCRHRGTRLCNTPDGTFHSTISCPYHAWTYDLTGRLIGAPHMDGTPRFCKDDYPLYRVGAGTWDGHLFINLDGGRSPLEAQLADLPERFRPWKMEELRVAERIAYDVKANWKLIIQNYSECLHCPIIHPAFQELSHYLNGDRDARHPSYFGGGNYLRAGVETLSMDGKRCADVLPGLCPEDRGRVYYYAVFPNLLLSLHPDYMMTHTLWPRSPERTEIICEWHFHPEAFARPGFNPRGAVEFWDMTNRQDWQITELSQLGLKSRVHTPGPYSDRESLLHYFDRIVAQDDGAGT